MESVEDKIKVERSDLNDKISRLSAFLESQRATMISAHHLDLLTMQLHVMSVYSRILTLRLDDIKDNQD